MKIAITLFSLLTLALAGTGCAVSTGADDDPEATLEEPTEAVAQPICRRECRSVCHRDRFGRRVCRRECRSVCR